jgi:hypothetical protein
VSGLGRDRIGRRWDGPDLGGRFAARWTRCRSGGLFSHEAREAVRQQRLLPSLRPASRQAQEWGAVREGRQGREALRVVLRMWSSHHLALVRAGSPALLMRKTVVCAGGNQRDIDRARAQARCVLRCPRAALQPQLQRNNRGLCAREQPCSRSCRETTEDCVPWGLALLIALFVAIFRCVRAFLLYLATAPCPARCILRVSPRRNVSR